MMRSSHPEACDADGVIHSRICRAENGLWYSLPKLDQHHILNHLKEWKNNAFVGNTGHFDNAIDSAGLERVGKA